MVRAAAHMGRVAMADRSLVRPKRDGTSNMLEARKGDREPRAVKQLDLNVRRDVDREFLTRGKAFMKRSVDAGKPFFLYFNHSLLHMPTIPRPEFKGKSGQGDWADCLLQLDSAEGTQGR